MNQPVVTSHQPSMTEWFAAIGADKDSAAFRAEDNSRTERLETLYQTISLPYERPTAFPASELCQPSAAFAEFLDKHGAELCAIRLVPNRADRPKLRQRGLPLRQTYKHWFREQTIDPAAYTAYIFPHSETLLWSAAFVVNQDAIFGEIVRGLHA